MLGAGQFAMAGPIGTAFTYQGRLIDANEAADGLYDFQFKLFDANSGGNKYGTDVNKPEVDVIDGYFTVELDFGSVFDGNDRWLLIGVRPGDSNDPNEYTILEPRQKITPAPYALYAKSGTSGPVGPVGPEGPKGDEPAHQWSSTSLRFQNPNGTWGSYVNLQGPQGLIGAQGAMGPRPDHQWSGTSLRFQVASGSWGSYVNLLGPQGPAGDSHWLLNGDATYYNTGNVGIGTNSPERILHIVGVNPRILIEASSISPEINFKNTGDSTSETWSLYKDGGTDDLRFYQNGNRVTIQNSTGNVGIDTIYPWSKLSVGGPGYGYTGIYGEGDDYGIYGFSDSGVGVSGINNSTYNEGMLGGDDYGVKSEGDLVVTGAYRGDIGPNKGAPFPRPAYDSGWQGISDGETKTLTHNIGGDPDNYVVDLTMKGQTGTGVTNRGIGADVYYESQFLNKGFFWKELTDSQIKVHREEQDLIAGTMRIRIWVYN